MSPNATDIDNKIESAQNAALRKPRPKLYRFTIEQLQDMDDNNEGGCIACGETQDGCEPDATKYECDSCGGHAVYGAAELALMGYIK